MPVSFANGCKGEQSYGLVNIDNKSLQNNQTICIDKIHGCNIIMIHLHIKIDDNDENTSILQGRAIHLCLYNKA